MPDSPQRVTYPKDPLVAFSVPMKDGTMTARDGNGLIIDGGMRAYLELAGLDLQGEQDAPVRLSAYRSRRIPQLWPTTVSSLRLQSISGQPLTLDQNASSYVDDEKISVYTGAIRMTWTETQWFSFFRWIRSEDKSSDLDVQVTLRFRVDVGHDDLLACFDPNDTSDQNHLICIDATGQLANPIRGRFGRVRFRGKSNQPIRWQDPAAYVVRKAVVTIS